MSVLSLAVAIGTANNYDYHVSAITNVIVIVSCWIPMGSDESKRIGSDPKHFMNPDGSHGKLWIRIEGDKS